MMATCSVDEYVKVWDIANNGGTDPKLISYKKLAMVRHPFLSNISSRVSSSLCPSIKIYLGYWQQADLRVRSASGT